MLIFSPVFKDEVIFGLPHGLQEPCGVGSGSHLNPILNINLSFFFLIENELCTFLWAVASMLVQF